MHPLQKLFSKEKKLAVGLISGTSLDGVDAALLEIRNHGTDTEIRLIQFQSQPYPPGLKETILENSTPGRGRVDALCRLNALLGEIFAEAAHSVIASAGLSPADVDLIGSHGQTVHHLPEETELFDHQIKSTLQLGEPAIIAKRTGRVTVADFRPADMALDGQGAPLVPYFDYVMLRSTQKNRVALNIGGIANFTVLKKNGTVDDVMAFDTGPGNMVIDALMHKLFNKPYDDNGQTAQRGKVSEQLLTFGMEHPFIKKSPPKSTGREEFGEAFCERFIAEGNRLQLSPADLVATAAQLTARSVWQNYQTFFATDLPLHELIVSGGGARNTYLMAALQTTFQNVSVKTTDEFGIPADAKEAICFAVLANETLAGNPNNIPRATGATKPTILGKICLP